MNIQYIRSGDYHIPDLKLPEETRPIGKRGRMHRRYLEEHHPIQYADLVLFCKLWTYLANLNEQAQECLDITLPVLTAAWVKKSRETVMSATACGEIITASGSGWHYELVLKSRYNMGVGITTICLIPKQCFQGSAVTRLRPKLL